MTLGQPVDGHCELGKAIESLAGRLSGGTGGPEEGGHVRIEGGRFRQLSKETSMFPNLDTKSSTPQVSWEQRLLKNGGKSKDALKPEYQELKFTLHRKLVDKINLEALATIDNQRVRSEVRQAVISLIDAEPTLLSSLEKQQISDEVLDEVFGLGPLEPLLQDPTISDILVNTYQAGLRRAQGLAGADQRDFPRRPAPAAHHRQDRFARWAGASTNRRPWWTRA